MCKTHVIKDQVSTWSTYLQFWSHLVPWKFKLFQLWQLLWLGDIQWSCASTSMLTQAPIIMLQYNTNKNQDLRFDKSNKWSPPWAFGPAWGWDKCGPAYNTQLNHTVMHCMFTTGALTMIVYQYCRVSQGPSINVCYYWYVCCTYGTYCLSSFVSLLLHDLQTIAKLWLIDTSMTVILHMSWRHTRVVIIWLIRTTYVLQKKMQMQNMVAW